MTPSRSSSQLRSQSNPSNRPLAILRFLFVYSGICTLSAFLIVVALPTLILQFIVDRLLLPIVRHHNTGQSFFNMNRLERWLVKFEALMYRHHMYLAGYFGFQVLTWLLEPADGATLEFSGERLSTHENAIVICNHVTDFDFILMFSIAARQGMLGHVKFLAKNIIKYIPGVGWALQVLRFVFLKRDWQKDQKLIREAFQHLRTSQVPLWLITFLEGTRITEEKAEQSRAYARERGLKELHHVMIPRVKGFIAMIRELSKDGYVQQIVDLTFGYCPPSECPTLRDMLSRHLRGTKICINTRVIHIKDIPMESDEALTEWCYDVWYRKEKLLADFMARNEGKPPMEWHFDEKESPIYDCPYEIKDYVTVPFEKQMKRIDELYKKKKKRKPSDKTD